MRLHQTAEDLCSDFLSTYVYSPSTPTTILWEEFKAICCVCLDIVPIKEAIGRNKPNMQISITLQETVKELWHFKVLKLGQNLHANMEGFHRASHIL